MSIPNLKSVRKSQGLTQRELALRSGVNLATVRRAEQNAADTKASALLDLAEALGVSIDALMGREPRWNDKTPAHAARRESAGV